MSYDLQLHLTNLEKDQIHLSYSNKRLAEVSLSHRLFIVEL